MTYWILVQSFYPEVRSVAKESWLFSISSPEPFFGCPSDLTIHTTYSSWTPLLSDSHSDPWKILWENWRPKERREGERERERTVSFLPPFCLGVLYSQVQLLWGGPSSSKHLCFPCLIRPINGNSFSLLLVPGYFNFLPGSLIHALISVNTPFTKTSSNEQF